MSSLQIRELPEDVYETLLLRAQREGRSLAQQAIVELRKVPELEARQRRMDMIERLQRSLTEDPDVPQLTPPEELIRQDRDHR